jgi:hypothetical protein
MNGDEPFWRVVYGYIGWVITSSLLAVVLAILSLFGVQIPLWAAGVVLVIGIILAIYLAGNYTHGERMRLARQLRPVLTIRGIGPTSNGHYRIQVHNESQVQIRFRTKLIEIRPDIGYPLPVLMQPTHGQPHDEAEVPGGGNQPVDVFVDHGPPNPLGLKLMGNPPCEHPIRRDRRYEIRICVSPIAEHAVPTYRWFYIVPQPDGSVVFTPNGAGELARPG